MVKGKPTSKRNVQDCFMDENDFDGINKRLKTNSNVIDDQSSHTRTMRKRSTKLDVDSEQNAELIVEDFRVDSNIYETGIITRIYMEDFMCHRMFDIHLGQRVNFITGQNGSGKSAIVAAIQLCLGATAKNTGRGNSLGKLVREGFEGSAVVRVTLLNVGIDAYRQEDYGDRITIERQIKRQGHSGYTMLSKDGKVISREKAELERILHTFNIFVDNPCCVLTQEESKRFIQGHERDKYDFFLKATGLERTLDEVTDVKKYIDETDVKLVNSQRILKTKQDEVSRLKKEMDDLMALDEYDDKIRDILVKLIWYGVYEQETVVDELLETKSNKEKEIINIEKQMSQAQERLESMEDMGKLETDIGILQEEQEVTAQELIILNKNVSDKTRIVSLKTSDTRELSTKKSEYITRKKAVHNEIKDLRQRAAVDAEAESQPFLQAIQDMSDKIDKTHSQILELKEQRSVTIQKQTEKQESFRQIQSQARDIQNRINSIENDIRTLQAESGVEARFHRSIPQILKAIRQTRFQGRVYGPIGNFIKLRDANMFQGKVGLPIEKSLNAVLNGFLVTNSEDRTTLKRILRDCRADYDIRIYEPPNNQTNRYELTDIPSKCITIASLITVEENLIFNCLIDNANIERIIIVENEDSCQNNFIQIMNGREEWIHPLIHSAITIDGITIRYSKGNRASEPFYGRFQRLLTADTTEMIRGYNETRTIELSNLKDIQLQITSEQKEIQDITSGLQDLERNIKSLSLNVNHYQGIKRENELRLADLRSVEQIDTTPLEAEESELAAAIEDLTRRIVTKEEELSEVKKLLSISQNEKKIGETKKISLMNRLREKEQQLQSFINKRDEMTNTVSNLNKLVMKGKLEITKLETVLEDQQQILLNIINNSNKKTEELVEEWDGTSRPALGRRDTKEYLENLLRKYRAELEAKRRTAGLQGRTKVLVQNELKSCTNEFENSLNEFKIVSKNLTHDRQDYEARLQKWFKIRRQSSMLVARNFDRYMQSKGLSGNVRFDHEQKTLQLITQTDNSDELTQCQDVRQLSGGERSFTTLCLLMALGHVIESPFRVMDEYDVFLDQHAREKTLIDLQAYALAPEQRGRQFIIVTPQDLSTIITSNDVRVKRMPRPERLSAHGLVQTVIA